MRGFTVLSLCDGMSCGRIAFDRAGIPIDKYYASEIKDIGIKVAKANYPDTIEIGDVTKVHYKDGILYTENGDFNVDKFDIVIFGSPCQSFSAAMKSDMRVGLEDEVRSGLFFECYRVLKEVEPTWFLLENVRSMKDSDRDILTSYMGVEPIMIDSALIGPAIRKRYYWTNIPSVQQPKKKNIKFSSVLTEGYTERDKARCLCVTECRPLSTPFKMFHRHYSIGFWNLIFKSKEHYEACVEEYNRLTGGKRKMNAEQIDELQPTSVFDGVRYMNKAEMERCQSVPEGYTDCLTRNEAADVLGDGWHIDTIAHIFSYIPTIQND